MKNLIQPRPVPVSIMEKIGNFFLKELVENKVSFIKNGQFNDEEHRNSVLQMLRMTHPPGTKVAFCPVMFTNGQLALEGVKRTIINSQPWHSKPRHFKIHIRGHNAPVSCSQLMDAKDLDMHHVQFDEDFEHLW